jgi:glycosyltransferase involved in cell wall biosynthesis
MEQPLISILTPVYNGEKYLAECIESVLCQTYPNWEYVIVNNFSKDRSLEIARDYAEKDPRIKVLDNEEFLTALRNWNNTLKKMSPEAKYCKVVHADDWIYPECIEKMVSVAEDHPSVGVVGAYRLQGDQVVPGGIPYGTTVTPGRDKAREFLLGGEYTFGAPSAILMRSDLIRGYENFYNEVHFGSDQEACLELLQYSDFGFVHQVLTFSRTHEESVTSRMNELQPEIFAFIYMLKKYGKVFLDSSEYEDRTDEIMKKYYWLLGRKVTDSRNGKFWNFHKESLQSIGEHLNWRRVTKSAFLQVFWRLVDTRRNLRDLMNMIGKHCS